jgi:hypothetical protein
MASTGVVSPGAPLLCETVSLTGGPRFQMPNPSVSLSHFYKPSPILPFSLLSRWLLYLLPWFSLPPHKFIKSPEHEGGLVPLPLLIADDRLPDEYACIWSDVNEHICSVHRLYTLRPCMNIIASETRTRSRCQRVATQIFYTI